MLYNCKLQKQFFYIETSLKFTPAFCLSKTHFHKAIKIDSNYAFIFSYFVRSITKRIITVYDQMSKKQIEGAKNKSTFRSTKMIPIA